MAAIFVGIIVYFGITLWKESSIYPFKDSVDKDDEYLFYKDFDNHHHQHSDDD